MFPQYTGSESRLWPATLDASWSLSAHHLCILATVTSSVCPLWSNISHVILACLPWAHTLVPVPLCPSHIALHSQSSVFSCHLVAGPSGGRAGPPPSPAPSFGPSRRGSPKHHFSSRQRKGPDEGLFRPGCPIYSLRLPADQIQQHNSHLSAAIATANAVPDGRAASSTSGMLGCCLPVHKLHIVICDRKLARKRKTFHVKLMLHTLLTGLLTRIVRLT